MTRSLTLVRASVCALAFALAGPGAAAAAPTADPVPSLRLDGATAGEQAGVSVAGAGDVNGDGHLDVIVGAPQAGPSGRAAAGAAYVVFGPFGPGTLDLATLGDRGFVIAGATPGALAGTSVAAAGDVNGDGIDDVIVGAPGGTPSDEGTRTGVGHAYVVFGSRTPAAVDLAALGARGLTLSGLAPRFTDAFGWSVSGAGDVNHDGRDDVIVAAPGDPGFENEFTPGAAYVVYGRRTGSTVSMRSLGHRGFKIAPGSAGGMLAVSGAGDFNGDRFDDVVVGDSSGAAYVVFGRRTGTAVNVRRLGGRGIKVSGPGTAAFGSSVAGGQDVNGDGRDDLVIGAPQGHRSPANVAGGGAWVVFGTRAHRSIDVRKLGHRGFELQGGGAAWAGFAVAEAGRVNADKLADVVLTSKGSLDVVYGRRQSGVLGLDALPSAAGWIVDGSIEPNQWYSWPASGGLTTAGALGGDGNGDGRADVLAGSRTADHNARVDSGSAYLFFTPAGP